MDSWEIVLLTGGLSLITAILTSLVTTRLTRNNEVRKHITEERTKFYFEIFPVIDQLINNLDKLCHEEYWDEFMRLKAKMKLLASPKTFQAYEELFALLAASVNAIDMYKGVQQGENPKDFNQEALAKIDQADFSLSTSDFVVKYLPDREYVFQCIQKLYQEMRKDLGSNLK